MKAELRKWVDDGHWRVDVDAHYSPEMMDHGFAVEYWGPGSKSVDITAESYRERISIAYRVNHVHGDLPSLLRHLAMMFESEPLPSKIDIDSNKRRSIWPGAKP